MNEISLALNKREVSGKKVAKLRKDGVVPSVVYGSDQEATNTQSDFVATTKAVHAAGKHTPVHLTIDGTKQLAMIKTIDFDPVKHSVRHVAFHAIKQNEVIHTEAPIHLIGMGESPAEKAGLIILQALENIEIKAKPADLPESLEVSVEALETTEDKITIADIKLPEGVEFADVEQDLTVVIANVYEPSALQAANEAAGGDATDESEVESENGAAEEAGETGTEAKDESKKEASEE